MVNCCVPLCKNRSGHENMVTFYRFPMEETSKQMWLKSIRRPELKLNSSVRICSWHFPFGKEFGPCRFSWNDSASSHVREDVPALHVDMNDAFKTEADTKMDVTIADMEALRGLLSLASSPVSDVVADEQPKRKLRRRRNAASAASKRARLLPPEPESQLPLYETVLTEIVDEPMNGTNWSSMESTPESDLAVDQFMRSHGRPSPPETSLPECGTKLCDIDSDLCIGNFFKMHVGI